MAAPGNSRRGLATAGISAGLLVVGLFVAGLLLDIPAQAQPTDGIEPQPPRPLITPPETEVADLGGGDRADRGLPAGLPAPGQMLSLAYPLARPATESDPFGWRFSPSRQAWRLHTGVDLIAAEGTAVRAVLPGRVQLVEEISGYGLTVVIDHGRGWQSLYAHLLDATVQPGEAINAAQPLGRVGQSGRATTAHLHFELRRLREGRRVAVDPGPLLQAPLETMTKAWISSDPPP
ncbi:MULTISPECIES: M23 family metallopeptidase [Synechococcales]|uniref:M23 family metallopeptidase n=1 Tax=Synechococcus sp. CS-1325 TaxID=2847979 RepID=UPI00223AE432|nr:M23 family metallopeptidase [Synechococcus sp. CS-1325]